MLLAPWLPIAGMLVLAGLTAAGVAVARTIRQRNPVAALSADGARDRHEQAMRLADEHDAVTRRWLEYELDPGKMITYPAMSDGRRPLTAAFLRARKTADGLRPDANNPHLGQDHLDRYRRAVTDYQVAFDVAERDAHRLRDMSFTPAERARLAIAKQLLTVAVDQAATPAERRLAYRRARTELDGLIALPAETLAAVEQRIAHALPAPRV